jgi:Uma2 family endonuclease
MAVAEIKITVQEFHSLQFEGEDAYYELINGIVVRKASPSPEHQEISQNLNFALSMFVRNRNSGKIFAAPTDVFLDEYNHLIPDLCFISESRLGMIDYREGIFGVPDLVVEIISPGSVVKDRVDKHAAYERCGVREYWLVDPENRSIEVLQNLDGNFYIFSHALGSGIVRSEILDGFEVVLEDVMG